MSTDTMTTATYISPEPSALFKDDGGSQLNVEKPQEVVAALFSPGEHSIKNSIEKDSPTPLFKEGDGRDTLTKKKEELKVESIFTPGEGRGVLPTTVDRVETNPLFTPGEGSLKVETSSATVDPLFNPSSHVPVVPKNAAYAPKPTEVSAVFEAKTDPYADQFIAHIKKDHPEMDSKERVLRDKMNGLFPLDFDKISTFAENVLKKEQALVSESKRIADLHTNLNTNDQLSAIMNAAKGTQKAVTSGSILSRLKQEVVAIASHDSFGPAQWYATLHRLKGSLKLVATETPAIMETAGEVLENITQYAIIMQALAPSIRDMSIQDAANRRLTLLLGALQQSQITIKQVEQLQNVVRTEMQVIDETITVTLPALGFVI